jgi:hypothetical protein
LEQTLLEQEQLFSLGQMEAQAFLNQWGLQRVAVREVPIMQQLLVAVPEAEVVWETHTLFKSLHRETEAGLVALALHPLGEAAEAVPQL